MSHKDDDRVARDELIKHHIKVGHHIAAALLHYIDAGQATPPQQEIIRPVFFLGAMWAYGDMMRRVNLAHRTNNAKFTQDDQDFFDEVDAELMEFLQDNPPFLNLGGMKEQS
jgi:hypothetical protein